MTPSMKLSKNNLLMRHLPRFSPMRRGILWQQIPRVRKLSSVSNQEETAIRSLIFRVIPTVRFVRRQKKTRASCGKKPQKRVDGIAPSTKFGDIITADHKILNVENGSRGGHKNALVVQDNFTDWTQSYPMKTKETSETMSCYNDFFFRHRNRK